MMWFSLSQQTVYFLASIAFGAALAVIYDLVRAVRMLIRCGSVHILISDILFFFVCGVLTSLFALPFNKGDVRAFIVFGEAVGFLAYRLTLGRLFGGFYAVIARLLRRFLRKICEKLKKFYDFLLKAGGFLLYNITVIVGRLRRAICAGVAALASEAAQKRRLKKAQKAAGTPSRKKGADRAKNHKFYAVPQRRNAFGIKRKKHEQKRNKTRKKREKARRKR